MSKILPLFFGKIINGKLHFTQPAEWARYLARLEGQEFQASIEKKRKKRTSAENRYYWAVPVKILADFFGYTSEEMNECLKWQFLRVHQEGKPDTVKSTTDLSTVGMEDYLSRIRMWASADYSVFIPEPNEVDFWE